ncbi:lasso peptide biosynthesis B2 protein [Paenibacillus thiaminolyticus]|uniref:lasso peptide biosynthesis B2 protein n=1 Tax=Paenibacillus thiaminolyticus TaxID=49283 RepID=UPI00232B80DE|nr:lasso peptide biosynthesis B2 protein [Paenibacillus thiaminolyticus]WCF07246.1 lasso peptide biosynthesis B2 protein [Paenibacillus thiaminolyticus]
MDIPLFSEQTKKVSSGARWLARLAILLSAPLNWLPPSKIEKILSRLTRRYPSASKEQVQVIRDAVCTVSKRCRSQEGCLRRSLAVVVATWLKRRSVSWCTGYAPEPFRAHAWVELNGIPVGEPDDISLYYKVICVSNYGEEKLQKKMKNDNPKPKELEQDERYEAIPRASIRQLFALTKGHNLEFILVVILGILSAFLTLIQPNLVADLVVQSSSGFTVNMSLVLLILVLSVSMILTTIQYYLLQKIGEGVVFEARSNLISHLLRLPIFEYDKRSVGDLLSRVSGDSSRLRMALIQGTIALTSGSFIIVGAAIGLALKDFLLFLTTLVTVCLAFIGIIFMSKIIQKASFRAQQELGKLSGLVERDLHAIRTIRSTNATSIEENKAKLQAEHLRKLGIRLAKIQSFMTPIANMSLQVCGLIVLGFGGYRVSMGYMTIADLIAFALLLFIMIGPVGQIFGAFSGIGESLGAFARIRELLDLALESDYDTNSTIKLSPNSSAQKGMVVFEKVSFGYNKLEFGADIAQKAEEMILKEVTLSAEYGKRTAIVGPSGAGKSTILQLIERFYDPISGQIYVDGKDYRSYSREELRKLITYVEQNAPVVAGTLRDNLLLGNSNVSDQECYDVLKEVNLSYLIERSSEKLDMKIGESGTTLSGGERQRLAMARSLLSKAKIVLLDELTSNLDSLNEIGLKKAVDKMRESKTVIVVAHRLSTIVDSDIIYVLEHGRIVGSGNHNELLDTVPLYRELAKEQFLVKAI